MKTLKRHLAIALAATLASPCGLSHADSTWSASGVDSNFNNNAAWNPGDGVPDINDLAIFDVGSHSNSPQLSANSFAKGFSFASGTSSYSITPSGFGGTLTIGLAGIVNNDDSTQAFNAPIILAASQSWNTASSGAITVGGTVDLSTFTLALSGSDSGAGSSTGIISGSGGITKSGTGTWTLSGANSYSGTTTINGGTLVFTGHKSGTGDVIVSASGKLAGTNTVAGITTINGTISPGAITDATGILTTGAENWESGGHYLWDISNATGTAGADWDLLSISGALAVNSTSGTPFFIDITGTASNFSGATDISWIIASATSINGFAADKFTLNAAGLTNSHPGTFSISQSGTDLLLNYAAPVPEPESWRLIMGASILLIVLIRRRRMA